MSRFRVALLAAALAAGCRDKTPIADVEISLHVTGAAEEVEFGKGFPLTVVRVWSKDLIPEEWSDRSLAPLHVRPDATTRREDDRHVEETRRYLCYAFSLADLTVKPPSFKATPKGGGPERVATADEITIRVKPALSRESPGPAELPGEPLPEPFPWLRWSSIGAGVFATTVLVAWMLRRRAPAPNEEPAPPPLSAHARALERLERLRARQPRTPVDIEAFYVEASNLVREYIEEQFAVRASEMTTEEFLASRETAHALESSHCALLSEFLLHCDLVKFARYAPTARDREQLVASAAKFVMETGSGGVPNSERDPIRAVDRRHHDSSK